MKSIILLFLVAVFSLPTFSQQQTLLAGSSFSKKLLKNEKHIYNISLERGGYAALVVMQKGVDLAIDVIDPSGKKVGYFDSPNGSDGPEPVTIVPSKKGKYRLHIYPLLDEPGMSDSAKLKWADTNQGAYDINSVTILSAKEYQQKLAKEKADKATVINWITENAHPLKSVTAGNGFEDLEWLKPVLQNVRYLGLGTATAGTREFFQMNHRMFEFLVKEMGFNDFAIEASFAGCKNINDYVLYGKGDVHSAVQPLWWGTQEMIDMVEWMHSYNQGVTDDKKLKFLGIDPENNSKTGGIKKVQDYLKKVDPVFAETEDGLFEQATHVEDNPSDSAWADGFKKKWNDLLAFMQMKRGFYVQVSSEKEYEEVLQLAIAIAQENDVFLMTDKDPNRDQTGYWSYYIASNFEYLVQREKPGTKFLIWAPDFLIVKDSISWLQNSLGSYLKAAYGDAYYAMGFSFSKGNFQSKLYEQSKKFDEMAVTEFTQGPAKPNTLDWYLAQAQKDKFIINFRGEVLPDPVKDFIKKELNKQASGEATTQEFLKASFLPTIIDKDFDGFIFIDNTTASKPLKR